MPRICVFLEGVRAESDELRDNGRVGAAYRKTELRNRRARRKSLTNFSWQKPS